MSLNERNGFNCFKQLHENFDLTEHEFLVMSSEKALDVFPKFKGYDLDFLPKKGRLGKFIYLRKRLKQADSVIFNSLIFNNRSYLFVFALSRKILKKAAWIEWGGDLYNWRLSDGSLKSRLYNFANRRIRENVAWVGVTFEADQLEFERQFPNSEAKIFYTPLPFGEDREDLIKTCLECECRRYPKVPLRVQVSHNSLQVNDHVVSLYALSKFKDEKMKVFLPVSYGSFGINGQLGGSSYKNAVCGVAKTLFGDKAKFLMRQYPLPTYLRYLWTIDVAVFDSERPIGLANVFYLLALGKKVYINGSSPQYRFLVSRGVKIFDSRDIPNITFEEFARPVRDVDPRGYVADKFAPGKDILHWRDLLEALGR